MLTKEQIERGKALCAAAPDGPWEFGADDMLLGRPDPDPESEGEQDNFGEILRPSVGRFCAEARTLLPAALDALEQVTAERDLARHARDGYHADIDVQRQVIRELRAQIEHVAALLPRYRAARQGALNDGSYGYDTQESVVKYEAKIDALEEVLSVLRGGQ